MLTGLFFKCADGALFHVAITYHDDRIEGGVGEIEIHDETGDRIAFALFYDERADVWGKYSVLSRMIKKAGIFDHGGISIAESETAFPYHAAAFDQYVRNEQKIRLSLSRTTKYWGKIATANRIYKHKFAEK